MTRACPKSINVIRSPMNTLRGCTSPCRTPCACSAAYAAAIEAQRSMSDARWRRSSGVDAGNPVDDQVGTLLMPAGVDETRRDAGAVETAKDVRLILHRDRKSVVE